MTKLGGGIIKSPMSVTDRNLFFCQSLIGNILDILEVGLIILDGKNKVVYKNGVLLAMEKRLSQQGESEFFVKKAQEMAPDLRASGQTVRRYHVYGDRLYRVFGLYDARTDEVIYMFDEREAASEYERLLKTKKQMETVSHLAAGFAHELRNPLSIIRGFIQLSRMTGNIDKYYGTILSELNRMNRIIDDFLSLSRKKENKERCEPGGFFTTVAEIIQSECLLRNIDLRLQITKTARYVLIDKSMMIQVVLNLFRNAVEAISEDQKEKFFSMEGRDDGSQYTVVIQDNGSGMDEAVLRQIGKPFFTTKENGTGVGLPLSQKIISEHGGKMTIQSEKGKGTTICFHLPYN
ncbi:two-component system sensor histidine kinase NtrB [Tuberibacillus calidus]|jgi:signal transduction histidine kinase|uniref:two-component system sensor histidine kinase NtrB n=1 Tax=Tuberibacillus calidus TaxID=340097 RepID=UPI0006875577|nr:HAMP domain-containing sensor histidine kinase [Tuberibacillus calidus]